MRITSISLVILSVTFGVGGACANEPPPASGSVPTAPKTVPGTPLPAPFDSVVVDSSSKFAHDRGRSVTIKNIAVDGVTIPADGVIGALVGGWKGWDQKGARSEDTAKKTVLAFAHAWQRLLGRRPIEQMKAPIDVERVINGEPAFGPYSPPTASVMTIGGERVVIVVLFANGPVGNRTKEIGRVVHAYRLQDGTAVKLDETTPIRGSAIARVGGGRRPRVSFEGAPTSTDKGRALTPARKK